MTTMPAEITYGHVTGRFIAAWTDGPDAGRLPDPRPLEGLTVKITPKVQARRLSGAAPVLVATMPVTCKVDADGRLIDEQGNPGVWLVTGVYGVTYAHPAVSIPAHDIEVTDAHTEGAPLDLVTAMPPGGPVLTASQYAELSARIDALGSGGGGGTGAVSSVNGQTGAVVLDAADVGALPDTTPIPSTPADIGAATAAQGTKADTAVQPDDVTDVIREGDARLDDARTPTSHTHVYADIADPPTIPDPQTLSLTGSDLHLSGGGGTVTLPSGGGGGGVGAPAPLPRVGAWIAPHWIMGGADVYPGTNGVSIGGAWFVVPTPCTVDALAFGVATAEASCNAKVVIYSTDATGRPSTLVLAGGSVSCATTGAKMDTLSTPVALPKGIYWAQILPSSPGGTVRFRGFSSLSDPAADLHGHLNGGNPSYSLTADCGTFATPATSLEPSATGNTRNHTLVMLRRSA